MNHYDYFSDIEEAFIRRRGKHLLLSPLDWALMDEWQTRGVPLFIVIRAIDTVFDAWEKQAGAKRTIGSLSYCKPEVEAAHKEWMASQVGKAEESGQECPRSDGFTVESVSAHIDAAIEKLRAVNRPEIADDLRDAVSRLHNGKMYLTTLGGAAPDWEKVDTALADIEKGLEAAMMTKWKIEDYDRAVAAIDEQMAEYASTMEPDAYTRTHSLMLIKRLRDESGVPRLGLFHM